MMQDQQHEELISAYLDGELSPDEQARVLQLLESSEPCRQTLAAFQALRDRLRAYPREVLGTDLRNDVLAALPSVERPIPSREPSAALAPTPSAASRETNADKATVGGANVLRRPMRRVVASLVTLATVALIALLVRHNLYRSPESAPTNGSNIARKEGDQRAEDNSNSTNSRTTNSLADAESGSTNVGNANSNSQDQDVVDSTDGGIRIADAGGTGQSGAPDGGHEDAVAQAGNQNDNVQSGRDGAGATASSRPNQITAVYDVIVTGKPADDMWLREILEACGINAQKGVVSIDNKVADAIQERLLGGVPAEPDEATKNAAEKVRLVYVRAKGSKLDELYDRLLESRSTGQVSVVVPGMALGVDAHLLQATKLRGAAAVFMGLGDDAARNLIASRPSEEQPGLGPLTSDDEPGGDAANDLFSLLLIIRTR